MVLLAAEWVLTVAADSIIGAGLAPSPYREATERVEQLERELADARAEIESLHSERVAKSGLEKLGFDMATPTLTILNKYTASLREDLAAAREALLEERVRCANIALRPEHRHRITAERIAAAILAAAPAEPKEAGNG